MIADLTDQCNGHELSLKKLQAVLKSVSQEKSEAEQEICQLQKMWETEKAKEAEKISDLVKARELLLNSKVELQRSLDECKVDLERLQTSHKETLDNNQDLIRQHSKAIDDLKSHHVSRS